MFGPFSGRQLTTIIVAFVLVIGVPVGASAVTGGNVFVADSASGHRAKVDVKGNIQTKLNGSVTASRAPVNQIVRGDVDNPIKLPSASLLAAPSDASIVVTTVHLAWDSADVAHDPYVLLQVRTGGCAGPVTWNESMDFASFQGFQQATFEPG